MIETFRAHCPRCDGERKCIIHGQFDQPWSVEDGRNYMDGQIDRKLLQCAGCETVFYHQSSWNSEEWDNDYHPVTGETIISHPRTIETYPAPEKKSQKPDWIWDIAKADPPLHAILYEVYQAYEAGSFILASVGLRTAFDRTTEILKINSHLSFEDKVVELTKEGYIGETEANTLSVVTNAGNAAAHRGWAPDRKTFEILIATLEQYIYRVVVTGKAALDLSGNIPARPPRAKKQPKPTA
ncbi:MAG: DUF4145 domain-containing protein [Pseudomonas sp.]|jgi:hypothetical protein|uniref:DUF4145 domain-containing protein n=1 Tax=Pseudomonas sp. TaxID=306 RepID=UPI0023879D8D|nr:DUF4145 domain-containing protein [Pseudomonas sp.]MDP9031507.1 DUF4145 domain-containing protein [Pseudomonadota bacterium]MDE1910738.1 DUF4145 domain-containing protein [Pseudomonas sp.]MDE2035366.1 DUF4145 domain-containing protein [Pseudomonas sp.]MDE2189999.1 DUF4145 domain-containing protein [Pseudomonas sp.]MDE2555370.1 DUF4145 domain-containing protein [Pseudomonas sp.]